MIAGCETPGEKTVRLGLEKRLVGFYNSGDMTQGDQVLDFYPYNKERPAISLERAHEIAQVGYIATQQGEVDIAA